MTQAPHHTGPAQKRFTKVVTLLHLIDPVRGEPTEHSMDRHPHEGFGQREHHQKKFLDSFALICSTSRQGGDTAAAVCMEPNHPSGTILRLARNLGVPPNLVDRLQAVLDNLTLVATRGAWQWEMNEATGLTLLTVVESPRETKENEILHQIIDLTRAKIQSLLEGLNYPAIQEAIEEAIKRMRTDDAFLEDLEGGSFREWIEKLPVLASLDPDTDSSLLILHIKWASQARWVYSEHLEALFCPHEQDLPNWISFVYKLGRYYASAKNMLKLAIKQPSLFTSIHIEPVEAPGRQHFSVNNDPNALKTTLQRLSAAGPAQLKSQLGKIWLSDDPEARFRQACRHELTVHAEMQLLSFYDHHPEHTPRHLFMGTSKKACFLCHRFMSRHPLAMGVSASHQKVYPAWIPAPSSAAVHKIHKVLL